MAKYLIVAKATSVCGWYIEADSIDKAREIASGEGPDYSDLRFDEPDSFEITKVEVVK